MRARAGNLVLSKPKNSPPLSSKVGFAAPIAELIVTPRLAHRPPLSSFSPRWSVGWWEMLFVKGCWNSKFLNLWFLKTTVLIWTYVALIQGWIVSYLCYKKCQWDSEWGFLTSGPEPLSLRLQQVTNSVVLSSSNWSTDRVSDRLCPAGNSAGIVQSDS